MEENNWKNFSSLYSWRWLLCSVDGFHTQKHQILVDVIFIGLHLVISPSRYLCLTLLIIASKMCEASVSRIETMLKLEDKLGQDVGVQRCCVLCIPVEWRWTGLWFYPLCNLWRVGMLKERILANGEELSFSLSEK